MQRATLTDMTAIETDPDAFRGASQGHRALPVLQRTVADNDPTAQRTDVGHGGA